MSVAEFTLHAKPGHYADVAAFAVFNDAIGPLLAAPAERAELSLLHLFSRAD